ncbi:hypothetical protein E2C01_020252 [Portunus trituberculatus]|uniref:Uncharacterized protein n=1 Tax=Portunus trituberculatus TaxID=210409 RepID=A0A5B7E0T4_PORTR|nr:hypothetical protein [Portunus trituberculatus]
MSSARMKEGGREEGRKDEKESGREGGSVRRDEPHTYICTQLADRLRNAAYAYPPFLSLPSGTCRR